MISWGILPAILVYLLGLVFLSEQHQRCLLHDNAMTTRWTAFLFAENYLYFVWCHPYGTDSLCSRKVWDVWVGAAHCGFDHSLRKSLRITSRSTDCTFPCFFRWLWMNNECEIIIRLPKRAYKSTDRGNSILNSVVAIATTLSSTRAQGPVSLTHRVLSRTFHYLLTLFPTAVSGCRPGQRESGSCLGNGAQI